MGLVRGNKLLGVCLWRVHFVPIIFTFLPPPPALLPGYHNTSSIALPHPPHNNALPHHKPSAMGPCDHGLKSLKLRTKINLYLFNFFPYVFCHSNGKLTNTHYSNIYRINEFLVIWKSNINIILIKPKDIDKHKANVYYSFRSRRTTSGLDVKGTTVNTLIYQPYKEAHLLSVNKRETTKIEKPIGSLRKYSKWQNMNSCIHKQLTKFNKI